MRRGTRVRMPVFLVCLLCGLCVYCDFREANRTSPPPQRLRIVTGAPDGVHHELGTALAETYRTDLSGVEVTAHPTVGSLFNVEAIQKGEADLGLGASSVVYPAYQRGTERYDERHTNLRGIAVLNVSAVHIVARDEPGIEDIDDLAGRRIAFGAHAQGRLRGLGVEALLQSGGLHRANLVPHFLPFDEVLGRLGRGELDAAVFVSGYPLLPLAEAAEETRVLLLPFERERILRIRSDYPFFKPVVIPARMYAGQPADVPSIGLESLLICRADLSEELVYRLTQVFFDRLPELADRHYAARLIDPEQGPITPIPLHPGAARYYRERELLRW